MYRPNNLIQSTARDSHKSLLSNITNMNSAITSIVNKVNDINLFGNITAPQLGVRLLDNLDCLPC